MGKGVPRYSRPDYAIIKGSGIASEGIKSLATTDKCGTQKGYPGSVLRRAYTVICIPSWASWMDAPS